MSEKREKKGGSHLQKKEKTPRTKKQTAVLVVILVVAIVLALVVLALAVHSALVRRPDIPAQPSVDGDGSGESILGVDVSGDRKDDFYTFLVVGRDTGGGGNTDTILLAAYDVANQKLNVMSIPRDTMVNIPYDIKRINSVYNRAGGGDEGIQALYAEVSQLVGFMPDFEVVVEWEAVGQLVDAIGGVWFDVPRNMDYDDPTQNLHIHVSKGYQKLDGETAMGVVRWRHNNDMSIGYATGDIGRIETQQAFLKAVIEQCLKIENVTKIQEFAKIFTKNVQTDLTVGNLVWFAEQAIFHGLTMDNVNFVTLPGNYNASAWSRTYGNYQSYVTPYADELLAVVNESFNPYTEDRTLNQLDIMSINANGTLSSTTGVVEDTKAAQASGGSSSGSTTTTTTTTSTPAPTQSEPPQTSETPQTSPEPDTSQEPEGNENTQEPENGGEQTPGGESEQEPQPTPEEPTGGEGQEDAPPPGEEE
jgi:LCP family protein required for cell wall assembly